MGTGIPLYKPVDAARLGPPAEHSVAIATARFVGDSTIDGVPGKLFRACETRRIAFVKR
jgi:hypothetical protein